MRDLGKRPPQKKRVLTMSTDSRFSQTTDPAAPTAGEPAAKPPSIGTLFAAVTTQLRAIILGEVELYKLKITDLAQRFSGGAALLVTAAVLALYALGWALHSAELALALVLPSWAASLIVVGVLAVIAIILAAVGAIKVKKANAYREVVQDEIRTSLNSDVDAIKKGLGK